jgi:hypothetical protein
MYMFTSTCLHISGMYNKIQNFVLFNKILSLSFDVKLEIHQNESIHALIFPSSAQKWLCMYVHIKKSSTMQIKT